MSNRRGTAVTPPTYLPMRAKQDNQPLPDINLDKPVTDGLPQPAWAA